uniref:Uncharacterized protein n=1 Tax=Rhizophora mucronata TaxID=61149 RepID=A0A2P2QFI0_RHIMU
METNYSSHFDTKW